MKEENQEKEKNLTEYVINDDKLLSYFCELLEDNQIEFINQIEKIDLQNKEFEDLSNKDYKEVIISKNLNTNQEKKQKLSVILLRFIDIDNSDKKVQLIKERKFVLQRLWPHFVRNAIKFLRYNDPRDKGELKFDFGVKSLTDYFEDFSKFEELLYGIDEYYRDHTLHVFRVYLLGEFIIRKIFEDNSNKINIFDQPEEIKIEISEKEAIWCLIALCHDLGYPLERIDELNKKLIKILDYFGTSHFQRVRFSLPFEGAILDRFILKILSSKLEKANNEGYNIKIQSKYYAKYSNSYEKLNHGMMSCILLMKNLVYFKETDYKPLLKQREERTSKVINVLDDAKQYLIRREILRAIASHDNQDIYHIDMNTFSFLLIICDEIQEWSRPVAKKRIFYEIESEKKEKIVISKFNENNIDISLYLDLTDTEVDDYSKKKFQKFIRLLRSAVHSDHRKFNFKMSIENYNDLKYVFEYPSPSEFYKKSEDDKKPYNKPTLKKIKGGKEAPDFNIYKIIEL